jgi:hypothetical protein
MANRPSTGGLRLKGNIPKTRWLEKAFFGLDRVGLIR